MKNKNKNKLIFIKTNDYIRDERALFETFNNHYINISWKNHLVIYQEDSSLPEYDVDTINNISKHYENHPSVLKIQFNQKETLNFDFTTPKVEDVNKIIKSLNPRKATGADGLRAKILQIAKNVIESHLTNIRTRDIKENKFSEDAKLLLYSYIRRRSR